MTREEILAMKPSLWSNMMVHHQVVNRWMAPIPNYFEDISAAWQVLGRLREEHWCIEIKIADGCWVIMELLRTPPIKVEVGASTPFEKLPEAICKAALLAKLEAGNGL